MLPQDSEINTWSMKTAFHNKAAFSWTFPCFTEAENIPITIVLKCQELTRVLLQDKQDIPKNLIVNFLRPSHRQSNIWIQAQDIKKMIFKLV